MAKPPKTSVETAGLRAELQKALRGVLPGTNKSIGSFRWGVYAFFDYDSEPIYVGQTYEGLSSRIGRHLTNQRTDAVAMSVLDPFEVYKIRMYPLPDIDHVRKNIVVDGSRKKNPEFDPAKDRLNRLELAVFNRCLADSRFAAVLNEKDPSPAALFGDLPQFSEAIIVSDDIARFRSHPDVRIARRAQTIARLAQVISERQVSVGLRRSLVTQAKRLQYLAVMQFGAHGGASSVPVKNASDPEKDEIDEIA